MSNQPDGAAFYVVDLEGKPSRDLDNNVSNGNEFSVAMLSFGVLPEILIQDQADGSKTAYFGSNKADLFPAQTLKIKFWTNVPF